jgi:hypothetical protein
MDIRVLCYLAIITSATILPSILAFLVVMVKKAIVAKIAKDNDWSD